MLMVFLHNSDFYFIKEREKGKKAKRKIVLVENHNKSFIFKIKIAVRDARD